MATVPTPVFDTAPWRLSGTVYGVLLNDPAELAALGDAAHSPPYKTPPRAPVLFVEPRNTLAPCGSVFATGGDVYTLGANLALVIGRTACAVAPAEAFAHVAGCVLTVDLSVFDDRPDRHYRPGVRLRARDGSCVVGPRVAAVDADAAILQVTVDGRIAQTIAAPARVRGAAQLLADVSAFMTLQPGDLLLLGSAHGAPVVGAGQHYAVEAAGLGRLEGSLA